MYKKYTKIHYGSGIQITPFKLLQCNIIIIKTAICYKCTDTVAVLIIIIMKLWKLWCRGMTIVQSVVHVITSFALRNNILTPTSYYSYYYTSSFKYTDVRDQIEYFYFQNKQQSNK